MKAGESKEVERTEERELPQGRGESLVAQLDSAVNQGGVNLREGALASHSTKYAWLDSRKKLKRPPAFAVGGRCMMRLTRILVFPFFSLSIMDQLPLDRGAFQNAQRTFLETQVGYMPLTGQSTKCKYWEA